MLSVRTWISYIQVTVDDFTWVVNTSKFSKDFIKNCYEDIDEVYFPEVYVQYPKKLTPFATSYHFKLEEWKLENLENL